MNYTERASIIVSSLSKAEKRGFKLYCSTQCGEKSYLMLFDIIDNLATEEFEKIQKQFLETSKQKNMETAAGYLYKQLLNFLVQNRTEKHIQTKIYNHIQKSNLLFERKLFEEAADELAVAKELATIYEDDVMQMLISRTEMRQLSNLEFPDLPEKELVTKQMKLLNTMKYSRTINQHNFLLDVLNHRLLYKRFSTSEERKRELSDLVLSELNLISNTSYSGFQAEKIHLLFQSAYYLEIGNYTSAVRNYKRLIDLFNENSHLIQKPPIYYLNAIDGVLDSLLTVGIYGEMPHFIQILHTLNQSEYPTDFLLKVSWLEYYYQMMIILHTGEFERTETIQSIFADSLFTKISYLPLDTQLQFHLLHALLMLSENKIKEAQKCIKPVFSNGKIFQRLPLFKMVRIVNLLIQAELGKGDLVDSEVTALKRNAVAEKLTKTERLLFKFVQSYPIPHYQKARERLWGYYRPKINQIKEEKREKRILKQFDFFAFIESRIRGIALKEVFFQETD